MNHSTTIADLKLTLSFLSYESLVPTEVETNIKELFMSVDRLGYVFKSKASYGGCLKE